MKNCSDQRERLRPNAHRQASSGQHAPLAKRQLLPRDRIDGIPRRLSPRRLPSAGSRHRLAHRDAERRRRRQRPRRRRSAPAIPRRPVDRSARHERRRLDRRIDAVGRARERRAQEQVAERGDRPDLLAPVRVRAGAQRRRLGGHRASTARACGSRERERVERVRRWSLCVRRWLASSAGPLSATGASVDGPRREADGVGGCQARSGVSQQRRRAAEVRSLAVAIRVALDLCKRCKPSACGTSLRVDRENAQGVVG